MSKKKIFSYTILSILLIVNIGLLIYFLINGKDVKTKYAYKASLNGDSVIELDINSEYVDLGATIKINNKEVKVVTTGTVDTSTVGTYIIKYEPKETQINYYPIYRTILVGDYTPPKIKLLKGEEISMYVGDEFTDPGYEVTDNSGEDLQSLVTIEGEVDRKKVGTYEIKYTVKDSAGNSTTVTRKVTVKNRPTETKRQISASTKSEKGTSSKSSVNLTKNSNTVTEMHFTDKGINMTGYVKDGNGTYTIKLCKQDDCTETKMTPGKTQYYSGDLNLTQLSNGTYTMTLVSGKEMDVINELAEAQRIMRAKVGSKLVTLDYTGNKVKIKIENFEYQYDILISAGHGGTDPGASNKLMLEKTINLTQSLYEKQRYEAHGLKVMMIRTDDSYGIMMGSDSSKLHRRAVAIGYYGAVSHYAYNNHHNSIGNDYYSGWEILLVNQGSKSTYSVPYKIADEWTKIYPTTENHLRIYGRNYNTDALLNKTSGQTYDIKNWYAVQRIPYEQFNVYTVTYEGCYLSNMDDYNWYINNWKKLSEIKIKYYVESLGKTYIPNGEL